MRRRKKSPVLPLIAVAVLLAGALWLLLANAVFVVRDIQIVGAGSVPEADVRHLSGIRLGTRLRSVDAERVRLDVESDGRVAFVGLEKHFPNRVVLTVRPRSLDALVLIAGAGKVLVLDSDAYVAQITDRLPDAVIPYVTGLRTQSYMLGRQLETADGRCASMKAVVEALKANEATAYASEVNVADSADLRIITRKGTTVLLGNAEDMERKIAWMAGALADLEARGENGGTLDVSSGTKADYRPRESAESAAPTQSEAAGVQSQTSEAQPQATEVWPQATEVWSQATEAPAETAGESTNPFL